MHRYKLKQGALAQFVQKMEEKGYGLEYISARLDQHVPPVYASTVAAWMAGTTHPSQEQCSYLPSIVHASHDELFEATRS